MSSYPNLTAPEGGYVFLVTYGRSGSTLLQNLLNSIPGYCIRGENNNALFHLARSWHALVEAEPMRGMRKAGTPSDQTDPWYGAELTRPDVYGRSLADVFVREVLALPPGTRVGGFKEIRFHLQKPLFRPCMDFIQSFFPRARIVFNTRNHDAVAKSGWWSKMDPTRVARELNEAEAMFAAYLADFPGHSLKVHYDDYNGNPEALRPLYDFLGERFDEAAVRRMLGSRLTHPGVPV